jgi:hypothetical protein
VIKLTDILREIGDASSRPYSYDFYYEEDGRRLYGFNTESYPYTVVIYQDLDDSPNIAYVRFFVPDENDPDLEQDEVVTNKGELFRIMATVKAIVAHDLKEHPEIDTIEFIPAKRSKETTDIARSNLYLRYIKNAYPSATIEKKGDAVVAKLK